MPFVLQGGARGSEVGAVRNVVFAPGAKWLRERLVALDDDARRVTYIGLNYGVTHSGEEPYPLSASPFPGAFVDYTSTVRVWPVTVPLAAGDDTPAAFMEWTGEVWTDAAAVEPMRAFLTEFYGGNIVTLNAFFAEQPAGSSR